MKNVSIVIPVYNSETTLARLVADIFDKLQEVTFEIVLVNDGSKDNSDQVCKTLVKEFSNIKYIKLRKNFGEFNAVMCGLNYVEAAYAVLIDDDFQNPPSEIVKLLNHAQNHDYDVVYSYYETKKHHFFRNLGSKCINALTTYLFNKPKDLYLSSFKLLKKDLIDEIIKYKSPFTYIDGIIFQITDNIGKVQVLHSKREKGVSNYTVSKLLSIFLTALFGYSLLPLRITLFTGIITILVSIVYMIVYFAGMINEWGSPVIMFFGGLILTSIAILGEYMGRTFMHVNGNPQFIVKEVLKS
jgi:glycosyltransferase involved in cell wall biosynthesis